MCLLWKGGTKSTHLLIANRGDISVEKLRKPHERDRYCPPVILELTVPPSRVKEKGRYNERALYK
jgi:hypothetical protein